MRRLFLIPFLLCAGLFANRPGPLPRGAVWKRVAPDVELARLRLDTRPDQVVAVRSPAGRVHIAVNDYLDAGGWRQRKTALAAINGGFFDRAGSSMGLRVVDGRRYGRLSHADWGVFYVRGGVAHIVHTRDFRWKAGIRQAVQCGPRLVIDGRPAHFKDQVARRTGLGIQRDGRVVIAVSDSALSLTAWANLWCSPNGLNCRDALNLDGGPSSQLSLRANHSKVEVAGYWPVPDAVYVR